MAIISMSKFKKSKKNYAIKGVVVRKDAKGVGVRFAKMNHGQKKIIQTFITENTKPVEQLNSDLPAPGESLAEPPNFLKSVLEESLERE